MSTPSLLGPHGQPPGHRPPRRGGGPARADDDLWLVLAAGTAALVAVAGLLIWTSGQVAARIALGDS